MSADEEDYEVHVFATTDSDGYSDGIEPTPEEIPQHPPRKKAGSSGLIRIGLIALLVLAAVFFGHRMWGTQIARAYLNEPSPDEQFAAIDPLIYSEAVDVWSLARANLRASQNAQTSAAKETQSAQNQISTLEKALGLAGEAIDKSTEGLISARETLTTAQEHTSKLAASNLKAQLDAASAQVVTDDARQTKADANFAAAQSDSRSIEQTVEQLGKATDAAKTAMHASEAAVAAATSAGEMIARTEGEEAGNPSLLARLTFNIFSETQTQVSGAERAFEAASKALATGESQLAEASDIEAAREAERDGARTAAANAQVEKKRLQKLYQQLVLDREAAQKTLVRAQSAETAAASDLDEKQSVKALTQTQIAEARDALKAANAKASIASDDITTAQEHFDIAQADLSALRKKRALRSAVILAEVNSRFADNLRTEIGLPATADPTSDRFALSSEVLFQSGAADLGAVGKGELDKIAAILIGVIKTIPEDVTWVLRVDGHTDNKPLTGNGAFTDNWQLSQARALAVVKYLITKQGVAPTHLAANGFGQYQPIRSGDGGLDLAINRRIELFITPK
ncbi:OmpA family protein [Profundibacter sp.]